jgi:hypothetical protein
VEDLAANSNYCNGANRETPQMVADSKDAIIFGSLSVTKDDGGLPADPSVFRPQKFNQSIYKSIHSTKRAPKSVLGDTVTD